MRIYHPNQGNITGWLDGTNKVQGVIDTYNTLLENNEDAAKIIEKVEKTHQ